VLAMYKLLIYDSRKITKLFYSMNLLHPTHRQPKAPLRKNEGSLNSRGD